MEERINKLIKWQNDNPRPPHKLKIMPTSTDQCNLSCVYCKNNFIERDRSNEISKDEYIKLIEEAAELGIEEVEIIGLGEPLLNSDILEIMKKIKKEGLRGNITTNGTLFNRKNVKEMIKIGWDMVAISLDGPNTEIQDKLRPQKSGKGSFKDVLNSLKTFNSFKEKFETNKPKIIFIPVLNKKNYTKAPEFIELAHIFNISSVEFKPLVTHNIEEIENYRIPSKDRAKIKKTIERTANLAEKYDIESNIEKFEVEDFTNKSGDIVESLENLRKEKKSKIACYNPWLLIQVFPEEKTANPCLTYSEYGVNIEDKTLKEIWYSERFKEIRKKLNRGEIPSFCENCCEGNVLKMEEIMDKLKKYKNSC